MSDNLEAVVDRIADPKQEMAEQLGQALARRAAGLYDREPGRAAWVHQLAAIFLERAADLRTLEFTAEESGEIVGE